jgi:Zn-dependent metalloprotease
MKTKKRFDIKLSFITDFSSSPLYQWSFRQFFFLIFLEILFSPLACANFNKQPDLNHFMNMSMELSHDAVVKIDELNKTVITLKEQNLSASLEGNEYFRSLQSQNEYAKIGLAFLCAGHLMFQLNDPLDELSVKSLKTDELGFTHIKFQQSYKSIPVWASEIALHLNQQNQVYLIQGRYIPTPVNVNPQPVLSEKEAMKIVAEKVGFTESEFPKCRSEIIIFADTNTAPCLAYHIQASLKMTEGWEFIIDATSGVVLKKLSTVFNDKSHMERMN